MVGQYLNKTFDLKKSQKTIISDWIGSSIKGEEWIEGYDLHIDEIVQSDPPIKLWIPISLSLLEFAQEELNCQGYNDIIPIVFIPLYSDERERGISFSTWAEIESELDLTPPSLFICPRNWKGFIDAYSDRKIVTDVEYKKKRYTMYYYEMPHDNGLEYVRNVSILENGIIR